MKQPNFFADKIKNVSEVWGSPEEYSKTKWFTLVESRETIIFVFDRMLTKRECIQIEKKNSVSYFKTIFYFVKSTSAIQAILDLRLSANDKLVISTLKN